MSAGYPRHQWVIRATSARRQAKAVLAKHESSPERVITLEGLLSRVKSLPEGVRDYFSEAISCLQHNLCRAAVVAVWSGFMGVFTDALNESRRLAHNGKRASNGGPVSSISMTDFAIIETARRGGFISKQEMQKLHGHLATRNECAHFRPGSTPSLNEAVGVADALLNWVVSHLAQKGQ